MPPLICIRKSLNVQLIVIVSDENKQKLEVGGYDTKPIWEQVIQEIVETRRELSERLDHIEAVMRENLADLRDVEDRLDKIEAKPRK